MSQESVVHLPEYPPRSKSAVSLLPDATDTLPQAFPGVTTHDRLFAQMDRLEEQEEEANTVLADGGFLGAEHSKAIEEVRQSQINFARHLASFEQNAGMAHYKDLWNVGDTEMLRKRLFEDPHFETLNKSVQETFMQLERVAQTLEPRDQGGSRGESRVSQGGSRGESQSRVARPPVLGERRPAIRGR